MYVRRNLRPSIILWFCWKHVVFFIALSTFVYYLYVKMHLQWVAIPFLPTGTIGTAVAFYIGFKNNSSYERLWEGRKIWGAITGLSRAFGMLVMTMESDLVSARELNEIKQRLLKRQINWCDLLRLQLRQKADFWNADRHPAEVGLTVHLKVAQAAPESPQHYIKANLSKADQVQVEGKTNPATSLLAVQINDLTQLHRRNLVSSSEFEHMLASLTECVKEQGSAERLKKFPFPRQYAYFSGVFVWIFLLLLPFSLIGELPKGATSVDWMVIPFSTLISWIFLTMEQVGDTSEDPFEAGLNDVPISAICRGIEIELLELLGEPNLPAPIAPIADILM